MHRTSARFWPRFCPMNISAGVEGFTAEEAAAVAAQQVVTIAGERLTLAGISERWG